jgi:hypothetical protein
MKNWFPLYHRVIAGALGLACKTDGSQSASNGTIAGFDS